MKFPKYKYGRVCKFGTFRREVMELSKNFLMSLFYGLLPSGYSFFLQYIKIDTVQIKMAFIIDNQLKI